MGSSCYNICVSSEGRLMEAVSCISNSYVQETDCMLLDSISPSLERYFNKDFRRECT